jgi:hypothetical protein
MVHIFHPGGDQKKLTTNPGYNSFLVNLLLKNCSGNITRLSRDEQGDVNIQIYTYEINMS